MAKTISKKIREKVLARFGGKCGYCGKVQGKLQVDHIWPKNRVHQYDGEDINCEKNLMPACPRCNRYKSDMDLIHFRREVSKQVTRARNYSWNFRMAEDFGMIKEVPMKKIIFYFEARDKRVRAYIEDQKNSLIGRL